MQKQHLHSIDKFMKLSNQQINNEFNDLEEEFYQTNKYQKLLYNCTKQEEKHNRYSDILPYQNNVIKCQGTQYFNASPIVLLSGQKLIATQAPVPPFENFWRVVIDQNVGLLVMLCALDDPKRGKQADQYWPKQGSLKQGSIKVTLQSVQKLGQQFQQRKMLLDDGTQTKLVSQIHWHGWQDFGVPSKQSLAIVQKMLQQIFTTLKKNQNVVLHCSAGVGRTGTLIAIIDGVQLLDRGQKQISIFEITLNMRKQRFGSIQRATQYQFVYEFLRRHLNKN